MKQTNSEMNYTNINKRLIDSPDYWLDRVGSGDKHIYQLLEISPLEHTWNSLYLLFEVTQVCLKDFTSWGGLFGGT